MVILDYEYIKFILFIWIILIPFILIVILIHYNSRLKGLLARLFLGDNIKYSNNLSTIIYKQCISEFLISVNGDNKDEILMKYEFTVARGYIIKVIHVNNSVYDSNNIGDKF